MSKRKCDSGKTGGPKTESNGIHQNSSEVGPKMGRWIPGSEHQETESQVRTIKTQFDSLNRQVRLSFFRRV